MRECEHYEILVSVWQDGELDRGGQVEMTDHLVRCAGCRDFYLDTRGLDGLMAAIRTPAGAEEPSADVWTRIERSAKPQEAGGSRNIAGRWMRRLPLPAWAAAAAAAVLLVVLVSPLSPLRNGPAPEDSRTAVKEIRLGGNPGGMDDRRFVEMTRSVLEADRKYREAFYQVMKQVDRDTEGGEASADVSPTGEGQESTETSETARGPS